VSGETLTVRRVEADEREWLADQLRVQWASTVIVYGDREHDAAQLPALVCCSAGKRLGLATYNLDGPQLEVVTLQRAVEGAGAGSKLLAALVAEARAAGCARLWLLTSNDNLDALRFYQRRGLRIVAIHAGAIDRARERKPSIPLVGSYGIAIHDELELELRLR